MNLFPLTTQQLSVLDTVLTPAPKFVFDGETWRGNGRSARDYVAVVKPLSKRTAKHDKLAVRAFKHDGVKPYRAPDYAARNAGLVGTIH